MAITRKDLLNEIEGYKKSNISLHYENKKLKDIISHYEKFVSVTNRQTLHRDLGRIRDFAEKNMKKSDI